MTCLQLEVRADNRVALGLYRRMGFSVLRWLDDYYVDGCAAWQMSKVLSDSTLEECSSISSDAVGKHARGSC